MEIKSIIVLALLGISLIVVIAMGIYRCQKPSNKIPLPPEWLNPKSNKT